MFCNFQKCKYFLNQLKSTNQTLSIQEQAVQSMFLNIKIKKFKSIYNYFRMNCNFYWQPACFQLMSDIPTNIYLDHNSLNFQSQQVSQPFYEQIKNKCLQLELENFRLHEELKHLKQRKSDKTKRIVKRRKQEELEKKFRCHNSNCKKEYASSLALNLHMKNKHGCENKERSSSKQFEVSFEKNILKQEGQNSNLVELDTYLRYK